jgi:transcriptional regulator with XRE-family HTH domain
LYGAIYELTGKQIRAARAMLDWSRAELAAKSGISEPNITRIEAGGDTRRETAHKISNTFQDQGVPFTLNGGIEPLRAEMRTYQSREGLQSFLTDVYNTTAIMDARSLSLASLKRIF